MLKWPFHRETERPEFDPARQEPALRVSICTGEKTAGFIDKETQRFIADRLITNDRQLTDFCAACGVTPESIRKIY